MWRGCTRTRSVWAASMGKMMGGRRRARGGSGRAMGTAGAAQGQHAAAARRMTPCRRCPALLPPCCCALLLPFPPTPPFSGGGNSTEPRPCQVTAFALMYSPLVLPCPPPPFWCTQRSPGCTPHAPLPSSSPRALQVCPASLPPPSLACLCSDRLRACFFDCSAAPSPSVALRAPFFPPGLASPPPLLHRLWAPPTGVAKHHLRNARGPQSPQHAYHAAAGRSCGQACGANAQNYKQPGVWRS